MTTPPPGPGGTGRVISDLIDIPVMVRDGDLVVKLTESTSTRQAEAIDKYVVTPRLAENFDQALEFIRSAVADGTSHAAYLHGSFGAGKSHFLAVLSAILDHHPAARDKRGLADVLAKHDSWLAEKRFIEVKAHLTGGGTSLEAYILGGYVRQVRREFPDAPVPAVYRADGLLGDARDLRTEIGDEAFSARLDAGGSDDSGHTQDRAWGEMASVSYWTTDVLDRAFAARPESDNKDERKLRQDLVSALLSGPFKRYADSIGEAGNAYLSLDEGLHVVSRHAKEQLGLDGVIMLLDELILRFTAFINDEGRIADELQTMSKLIESSYNRPVPVISFVPRQRDLRDLVGLGGGTEGINRTIHYWEDRFQDIHLADANLTEVVRHRLINPRSDEAAAEIDQAFERLRGSRPEVRDTLLDSQGGADTSTWEDFRRLYPFSPALLHVMVEMSYALSRSRSAIKMLLQLLVSHRTTLPVGQMVPLGAVFDVLIDGEVAPFQEHLHNEYTKISEFYRTKVRDWLLDKHGVTEAEAAGLDVRAPFRRDDLLVKTLLLSALTPNVPALKDLTAGRAIALNQGLVRSRRTGQDVKAVTQFFKDMAARFGEVRVGAQADNPTIELNLLRVETGPLLRTAYAAANDHALRGLFKRLLWKELGLAPGTDRTGVVWRGTHRVVELAFGVVRSSDELAREEFVPLAEHAVRVVVGCPFDTGNHNPIEARNRVQDLRQEFAAPVASLAWLPTFLSPARLEDARKILQMEYLLQDGVIEEKAPDWSSDDRREARMQLDNQRSELTLQISSLLRGAYGLVEADSTDYGADTDTHVEPLPSDLAISLEAGSQFPAALEHITHGLLDALYPEHPDLSSRSGRSAAVRRTDLSTVLKAVEQAKGSRLNRWDDVPKADLSVLDRIAGPLRIATVSEVFVLRDDWRQEIDRHISVTKPTSTDVHVRDIKKWIRVREEGQGLPEDVVDLLVQVYAIQSDRAWIRAGKRYTGVTFGQIADEIILRRQELPSEEDFQRANERAELIFGLTRQPLRSARAVQNLAEQLKEQARRQQGATERLVGELTQHAHVLALDEDAPRLVTARAVDGLLVRLAGLADDTALVNALGQADLPEAPAVYKVSMAGSTNVAGALAAAQWKLLDSLDGMAREDGRTAPQAREILDRLQESARHNESSHRLATALSQANSEAVELLTRASLPDPPEDGDAGRRGGNDAAGTGTPPGPATPPPSGPDGTEPWVTVDSGTDLSTAVAELRSTLGIPAGKRIQITIRVAE